MSADICVMGGGGQVGLPLSIVFAGKGKKVRIFGRLSGGQRQKTRVAFCPERIVQASPSKSCRPSRRS